MSIRLASTVGGLSEKAFGERFGTEEQGVAVLLEMRWGRGFCCGRCGCRTGTRMKSRRHIQCNGCKHRTGCTAGTVSHRTKLPLTSWFQGICHLTRSKGGISSIELARRLGVRQPTARLMKQKLMSVMAERDETKPEMADRKPRRIEPLPVKGCRKKEVEKMARSSFATGTDIVSDGLSCWRAVEAAGGDHFPMKTGHGKQAARRAPFKGVNTTLGNIETSLAGTCHHVSAEHARSYLASFAWRFNRRDQLDTMTEPLMWPGPMAKPRPYRVIVAG